MKIGDLLKETIKNVVEELYGVKPASVFLEHPDNKELGDYATNVALRISQSIGHSPMEIAKNICYKINDLELKDSIEGLEIAIFEKVDIASPGFINFKISSDWLTYVLDSISKSGQDYGVGEKKGQKVMFEYTDPNPFKVFHIGHLVPNVIGESLSRLWEFSGYEIKRASYQGDVGMHVAKSIWGMEKKMVGEKLSLGALKKLSVKEKVQFLGQAYALGATAFSKEDSAADDIRELNAYVFVAAQRMLQEEEGWEAIVDYKSKISDFDESRLTEIKELYEQGRAWSLLHFEELYKILGTQFDFYYFESLVGELGYEAVQNNIGSGVFKKDEGAIIFEGEKYDLHTRVFINSFGFPTYEAKELGLAKRKYEDFKYDKSIVVTGNEIEAYFKVLLKVADLVFPDLSGKTVHIPHGMMKFSTGKMSSRTGDVVSGEELILEVKASAKERVEGSEEVGSNDVDDTSTKIAVGALKYSILKNGIGKNIIYDKESSLELTGNTGAYIQYAFVRALSVLERTSKEVGFDDALLSCEKTLEELDILRHLYIFPEIVDRATHDFAPNYVCTYLFELAQMFSRFYAACPILEASDSIVRDFRLALTKCTATVLENGLRLLGIETVSKM